MHTRQTQPADVSSSSENQHRTLVSTATYDSALERFGGRRIEARSSTRSSELLVALYESPPFDLEVAPMDFARLSINLTSVPVFGAIAA